MIGTTLGPYRIERELGSGGMGKVYAAKVAGRVPGLAEATTVALKVVHPHLLETPGFFKRFLREAEIGKSVVHENVVRTFDCDAVSTGGVQRNFLVMEYVEGQTLRALLRELDRVPEELCRHVGREIAKGLAAIHAAGVVHRDLKPENVLVTKDHAVKVMDLGVARLNDEALRLSQTGAFVGSIHYAAPECFRKGGGPPDHRADLHALGLVLYEIASGVNPYLADDVPQILQRILHEAPRRLGDLNPQLSPYFEEVVHTLLAKDPGGRFATAEELVAVLDEGEGGAWWKARAKALRAETRRPLRRVRIPRETAVYGRDAELAKLRALFDRAKAGEGQVVVLEGEAGIGKSRLVDELVGRLQRDGEDLHFLYGSYPPGGAATAAGAFSTAFREQFGADGAGAYLADTPLLVPAFDALLRGDATPTNAEPLTRDSLQTCFVAATRSLAAERTTVLLVDDLHFATDDARLLFTALATAAPGHRVLLVGTTRPGIDDKWLAGLTRFPQSSHFALARLGPKDLALLLRESFRSEHLAHSLGVQIALKSDGNPFFAFEIIRGLREGQFITQRDDGTWVSTRVIDDIRIPSSVLDLVNARVADLADDERNLLDVAACWGFEFDPSLVGSVFGMARIPTLQAFGRIEKRHRLVRSAGRNYVFDHHQVQEALFGSLNEQLREEYHAALATALETQHAAAAKDPKDLDGALCVDLAEHLLAGAQGVRAVRYLDAALSHLEKGYLNDAAIRLARRALGVPGLLAGAVRVRNLLRIAARLELSGGRDELRRAVEEAVAIADREGEPALRARAHRQLGHVLERALEDEAATAELTLAIDLARGAGARDVEFAATNCLGLVLKHLGRLTDAARSFERQVLMSRESRDARGESTASSNLGTILSALGRPGESRTQYERSLALARESGHRQGESISRGNLGESLHDLGRLDDARTQLEQGLLLAREIGARPSTGHRLLGLAEVAWSAGSREEAEARARDSVAVFEEVGDRALVADSQVLLGRILVSAGHFDEARTLLEQAAEAGATIPDARTATSALAHLATIPGGDAAAAAAAFARHEARLDVPTRIDVRLALFRATGDRAHLADAKRLLDDVVAHAPDDCRESMLASVRLHREIAAAAKEAGL